MKRDFDIFQNLSTFISTIIYQLWISLDVINFLFRTRFVAIFVDSSRYFVNKLENNQNGISTLTISYTVN